MEGCRQCAVVMPTVGVDKAGVSIVDILHILQPSCWSETHKGLQINLCQRGAARNSAVLLWGNTYSSGEKSPLAVVHSGN